MWCRLKKWNMISKNCDFFGIRISKFEKNAIGVSQSQLFRKIVEVITIIQPTFARTFMIYPSE